MLIRSRKIDSSRHTWKTHITNKTIYAPLTSRDLIELHWTVDGRYMVAHLNREEARQLMDSIDRWLVDPEWFETLEPSTPPLKDIEHNEIETITENGETRTLTCPVRSF